jgi:hypothetical protein
MSVSSTAASRVPSQVSSSFRKIIFAIVGILLFACEKSEDASNAKTYTWNIPENFIDSSEEMWIFLSDKKGNTLDLKQCFNGNTVTLKVPDDIADDEVTATIFNYFYHELNEWQTSRSAFLDSYPMIKPGNYNFLPAGSARPKTGECTVHVSDIPQDHVLRLSKAYSSTVGNVGVEDQDFLVSLYAHESDLLLSCHNTNEVLVGALNGVADDGDYSMSVAGFTAMNKSMIDLGTPSTYFFDQSGFLGQDTSHPPFLFYFDVKSVNSNPVSLPVFHNSSIFEYYQQFLSFTEEGRSYSVYSINNAPTQFAAEKLDVTLSSSPLDNGVRLTATGNADYLVLSSLEFGMKEGYNSTDIWNMVTPFVPSIDIVMPSIPQVLIDKYYPDGFPFTSFEHVSALSSSNFSSYNDFIKDSFDGIGGSLEPIKTTGVSFGLSDAGGRLRAPALTGQMMRFLSTPGLSRRIRAFQAK